MDKNILEKMINKAIEAQKNSYSPYSKFAVGASILTTTGNIFAGCNVEVANYKGICAEGSAISTMICAGDKKIIAIVIISPNKEAIFPCGDCRQRIREFANNETKVIIADCHGKNRQEFLFSEIFPHSFGPENL